ncbi:TniB family NTP-binding protein [Mycolicibacterium alvei]|uniref:TniB family NTP-binding protein n=1 Tax=Mycolicibacterium alvei TaxID=67081 RepID=UPI001F25C27D|nr:TniB family NTP-binding protein [Mycolicibacterium alvei]
MKQWNQLSDGERARHIEQLASWLGHLYVQTPELTGITDAMTAMVGTNTQSPPGAKDIGLLTGKNTVGKSTLMKKWAKRNYRDWTRSAELDRRGRPVWYPTLGTEADLNPVVWINLPPGAMIKEVDAEILEFFGLPAEGVRRKLTNSVVRAAEQHRVRVLVVDDTQFLKTNWKGGRDVLDHVKHINTELGEIGASVILIGADLENSDLVTDPQIAGRLKMFRFPRYTIDDLDEQRVWQQILRDIENTLLAHLPAAEPGVLFLKLAGELWHRTQGFLGDLTKLISGATLAATLDGSHTIELRHLNAVALSKRAELEHNAQAQSAPQRRAR